MTSLNSRAQIGGNARRGLDSRVQYTSSGTLSNARSAISAGTHGVRSGVGVAVGSRGGLPDVTASAGGGPIEVHISHVTESDGRSKGKPPSVSFLSL